MYRLNNLLRNVLITEDEVIFHGPTKQSPDPRTLQQAIIIAEERFVVPIIGRTFYDSLCNSKNVVINAGNKAAMQAKVEAAYTGVTLQDGQIVNAFEEMSADNQKLWKDLLWKLCSEAVLFVATPDNFVQFAAEGIVHATPQGSAMITQGSVTPGLGSVKWIMDKKLQDRIDPLTEALKSYLCSYKGIYPLYPGPCEDCNENAGSSRKTAWITSIYDDEDKFPCKCP